MIVADCAHILHTPINVLCELDVSDLLDWHDEARRIVRAQAP